MMTGTTGARISVSSKVTLLTLTSADEFESAPAESAGPNAVGMGWGGTGDDEDPWGALDEPAPPPVPIPVTELTSPPEPVRTSASAAAPSRTRPADAARPSRIRALSPSASPRITPLGSPVPNERGTSPVPVASPATVTGTTAGMTKEEKAAEMARKKEERKQVRLTLSFFAHFLF